MWRAAGWLLVGAIALTSLVPATTLPDIGVSDKVEHALTYAFLTLWFCGVYRGRKGTAVGLSLFAFGALLECLQAFTLTRSADFYDLIANGTGILVGLTLAKAGLESWCAKVESLLIADL